MTPRQRITPDQLIVVKRPDSIDPDIWLMVGDRVSDAAPQGVKDHLDEVLRRLLAEGLLDLVEQGYVPIGPVQRQQRQSSRWFYDPATETRLRCRVTTSRVVVYRQPFEDEPDWEIVGA